MTRTSELERIARIRAAVASADPRLLLGVGDDAAAIAAPGEPLVCTVDAAVEGVHFRRAWAPMRDVGYRATMAAASDLAAMGATPLALLAALILPDDVEDDALDELVAGQQEAAKELGAPIAGGNLSRGCELSITTTALGHTPHPLRRDGGRAGDVVAIAGDVGLAAAGLLSLSRGVSDPLLLPARAAFLRPRARIAEGLAARAFASAAIDVSDGLARDLGHLARQSGVTAAIDLDALVTTELADAARVLGADALDLALRGGEDYALVLTIPEGRAIPSWLRVVGALIEAGPCAVVGRASDGSSAPIELGGHDHFARH